jgi:hypothetical protein
MMAAVNSSETSVSIYPVQDFRRQTSLMKLDVGFQHTYEAYISARPAVIVPSSPSGNYMYRLF